MPTVIAMPLADFIGPTPGHPLHFARLCQLEADHLAMCGSGMFARLVSGRVLSSAGVGHDCGFPSSDGRQEVHVNDLVPFESLAWRST